MGEPKPLLREVYRFGDLRLDVGGRRLTRAGEAVSIPPKAFELLQYLVRNADRAVTRTELLDAVWRDTVVEEGNLGWNMSVLRKAIDDADGKRIETVRGYGYRLAVPVERESTEPAVSSPPREEIATATAREVEPVAPEAVLPQSTTAPKALLRVRAYRSVGVGLLSAGLLALAGWGIWNASRSSEIGAPPAEVSAGSVRPTLAVLPFENLSQRGDTVWLATALAEMLHGEVAAAGRARTTPGESLAQVTSDLGVRAGSGLSPATLARLRRQLGIDLVVVGNYVLLGDTEELRVDFRLQSADDGRTLVAGSESGRLSTLFDLVARSGRKIAEGLPAGDTAVAVTETSPPSTSFRAPTAALRAYAEGLDLRRRFQLSAARSRLEEAVAAAPDFALAHAALADLLAELGYLRQARDQSRRALLGSQALPPAERLSIEARDRELAGHWPEAVALWKELAAIDAAPVENQLALARALSHAGDHAAARATLAALERRPPPGGADPRVDLERGWVERYAQNFPAMRAAGLRAVESGRNLPSDYILVEGLSIVGWAETSLGHLDAALDACEEGQSVAARLGHGRLQALHLGVCGWARANLGRREEAVRDFEAYGQLAERDGNISYQSGAIVAIGWQRAGEGRLASALDDGGRALALATSVDDEERELNALELVSHAALFRAELDRAEEATRAALARSREVNIASRIALQLGALGRIRLERGDTAGALAAHEEALALFPSELAATRVAARELDLARTRLEAGDAAGAGPLCDSAAKRLDAAGEAGSQRLLALALRARVDLAAGRRAEALAASGQLERQAGSLEDLPAAALALQRAELLAALGEKSRARAIWTQLLAAPGLREVELFRLLAKLRLAEGAEVTAAHRAARAAKLGLVLGEEL